MNDDFFYDLLFGKKHIFGSYEIEANLTLISTVSNKNIQSFLYFNNDANSFLLVKKYNSGKYHIDFFSRIDMQECLYDRNNVSIGDNVDIAVCYHKDLTKYLSFSWHHNAYVILSVHEENTYQTIFWKGFKDDQQV